MFYCSKVFSRRIVKRQKKNLKTKGEIDDGMPLQ